MEVAEIVRKDPNVDGVHVERGPGGASGANNGLHLHAAEAARERKLSVDEVIQELRPKLA